jgi:erythromycin esterase-like protein
VIQAFLFTLCSFAAVLRISFLLSFWIWLANEVVKLSNWLQDRSSRRTKAKAGATPPID